MKARLALALTIVVALWVIPGIATAEQDPFDTWVNEDTCTVTRSGALLEVVIDGELVATLTAPGDTYTNNGPVDVTVTGYLQRDNPYTQSFFFDCNPTTTTTEPPPCNPNQVECWCDTGIKLEPVATPFEVPPGVWSQAIVKAGSEAANGGLPVHQVYTNPQPGDLLTHSTGKDISHVILCGTQEVPPSTTQPQPPTTTTTEPPTTTTPPPPSTSTPPTTSSQPPPTSEPPAPTTTSTTPPPITDPPPPPSTLPPTTSSLAPLPPEIHNRTFCDYTTGQEVLEVEIDGVWVERGRRAAKACVQATPVKPEPPYPTTPPDSIVDRCCAAIDNPPPPIRPKAPTTTEPPPNPPLVTTTTAAPANKLPRTGPNDHLILLGFWAVQMVALGALAVWATKPEGE